MLTTFTGDAVGRTNKTQINKPNCTDSEWLCITGWAVTNRKACDVHWPRPSSEAERSEVLKARIKVTKLNGGFGNNTTALRTSHAKIHEWWWVACSSTSPLWLLRIWWRWTAKVQVLSDEATKQAQKTDCNGRCDVSTRYHASYQDASPYTPVWRLKSV